MKKVVVLGTGGTIAGTGAPGQDTGYQAAQLGVGQLLAAVPQLLGLPLEVEQVAQLDSKDMDFGTWQRLAARCAHWLAQDDVQGLVVTHGTDTLEETAYFLHRVLAPAKPVVLTCAMRPATAREPDGPRNLADAVAVACRDRAHGVVAVCAGRIHGPVEVAKVHPSRLDAFGSGDAGPLGRVAAGRVEMLRAWPQPGVDAGSLGAAVAAADPARWPRVEVVLNHAGASGALVEALLAQGVDGLVAAGTGNGTMSASLEAALLRANERGVPVLRASRCAEGAVQPHEADRLPAAGGLSPVKARIELLLRLLARQS